MGSGFQMNLQDPIMERENPVTEGVGAATPAPTQPQLVTARQHETLGR